MHNNNVQQQRSTTTNNNNNNNNNNPLPSTCKGDRRMGQRDFLGIEDFVCESEASGGEV